MTILNLFIEEAGSIVFSEFQTKEKGDSLSLSLGGDALVTVRSLLY
jgi:hypothetical protein